ncbi:MAG: hypothetical protein WEB58_16380 [Planctomycetaceae bacterium]
MPAEFNPNHLPSLFEAIVASPCEATYAVIGCNADGATGADAADRFSRLTGHAADVDVFSEHDFVMTPTVAPEKSNASADSTNDAVAAQPALARNHQNSNGVPTRRSLANALKKLHFAAPVQRSADSFAATDSGRLQDKIEAEKRRVPRCPGDSQVTVAVVPQHQGRSESEQRWNFISTPVRGSVLFLNVNGVSLSLNSPVSEESDVVLQMTHPTFKQSCTLSARILRCEQIGMLWHVACAFHQPITRGLMNTFCQLIQPRQCSHHLD